MCCLQTIKRKRKELMFTNIKEKGVMILFVNNERDKQWMFTKNKEKRQMIIFVNNKDKGRRMFTNNKEKGEMILFINNKEKGVEILFTNNKEKRGHIINKYKCCRILGWEASIFKAMAFCLNFIISLTFNQALTYLKEP